MLPPDFDGFTAEIWNLVRPFTMTSPERIYALQKAVEYVANCGIVGDIVECGVWKGGSMMAAARTLMACGARRRLFLFDTFEGMPPPQDVDRDFHGTPASALMAHADKGSQVWAVGPLDDVKRNMRATGYDWDQISFVQGRVEETIPASAPDRISLLRIDTDWYESTYHTLVHLYPRLAVGGVLILDDYGHWAGAKKAVDKFLEEGRVRLLLNRVDYTGRIAVKSEA